MAEPTRAKLYQYLGIAKRDLQLSEEAYRQLLADCGATEHAGRVSATTMSHAQLHQALRQCYGLGWRPRKRPTPAKVAAWRQPRINKITALWIALAEAGVVHERSDTAMQRWCAGITGKPRLDWATATDLNNCIEGLKAWAKRERVALRGDQ